MNIDKMVEGLDSDILRDKRGKRIYIGDNVVIPYSNSLVIDNVTSFYKNTKVRTNYGLFHPNCILVINDLFSKEELEINKENFEKKEAEKKKIKDSKIITKYSIAIWKNNKTKEQGITYIPFNTRPGKNVYSMKDIKTNIDKWNNIYPDLTFYYFHKDDFKFHPLYETNKKNLFFNYSDDFIMRLNMAIVMDNMTNKNKLILMKYTNKINQKDEFYKQNRISNISMYYDGLEKKIPVFVYNCCNLFDDVIEFEKYRNSIYNMAYVYDYTNMSYDQFIKSFNYDRVFNGFEFSYQFWSDFGEIHNIKYSWADFEPMQKKFKEIIDDCLSSDLLNL